ncbi:MAG: uroporphyrinogen decarboxylase family protein [Pseudomonadota bacterium]
MTKTPQELYNKRLQRVEEAIRLNEPDRVPFFPQTNLLAVKYGGISAEEAFYNHDLWFSANKRMIMDLEPDIYWPPAAALPGRALEALGCKQIKWPGPGGAPSHSPIQFVEKDYMQEEEYDTFIDDPTDYLIRFYLPRIFGKLEPLKKLPSIKMLFYQGYRGIFSSAVFTDPEVAEAFKSIYAAGMEAVKYFEALAAFEKEVKELGFPQGFSGAMVWAPFDVLSDMYRGMRASMLDMYRQPDKVLEAIEKITPAMIQAVVTNAKKGENPRVFIPLHRGADGFMSNKQFETFYWPSLKRLLLSLVDEGLTPCPFFEGNYNSRLSYLTELPKGKVVGLFDTTDLFKAKDILGDTMCIVGNMPGSLLQTGSPEHIKEYAKRLIDVVGKRGGFIMSSRTVLDEARPELVKIWGDFTKEYGKY